jgi:hypothetical protein
MAPVHPKTATAAAFLLYGKVICKLSRVCNIEDNCYQLLPYTLQHFKKKRCHYRAAGSNCAQKPPRRSPGPAREILFAPFWCNRGICFISRQTGPQVLVKSWLAAGTLAGLAWGLLANCYHVITKMRNRPILCGF